MLSFIFEGGIFMWPMMILAIVIFGLTAKKFIDLFVKKEFARETLGDGINAILFWGCFSMVLGIFSHFTGLYYAMKAISKANEISPAVIANGYAISLSTILSGLFLFMISAVGWLILRWRYKKMLITSGLSAT